MNAEHLVLTQETSALNDGRFETRLPSMRNALEIFEGKWISKIPFFGYGTANLFDDARLTWFDGAIGGFAGKKVIELGPLDGGHTYIMSALGASDIISIEANKDAYLRCLVIKEIFNLNVRVLCGDFEKYLLAQPPRVDVILASGVLYHMADPLRLIEAMTEVSDSICIWTHYYSSAIFEKYSYLKEKFDDVRDVEFHGRRIQIATQSYHSDITRKDFAGGTELQSVWIEKDGIIDAFDALGFAVTILNEAVDHAHGSSFTIVAQRRRTP